MGFRLSEQIVLDSNHSISFESFQGLWEKKQLSLASAKDDSKPGVTDDGKPGVTVAYGVSGNIVAVGDKILIEVKDSDIWLWQTAQATNAGPKLKDMVPKIDPLTAVDDGTNPWEKPPINFAWKPDPVVLSLCPNLCLFINQTPFPELHPTRYYRKKLDSPVDACGKTPLVLEFEIIRPDTAGMESDAAKEISDRWNQLECHLYGKWDFAHLMEGKGVHTDVTVGFYDKSYGFAQFSSSVNEYDDESKTYHAELMFLPVSLALLRAGGYAVVIIFVTIGIFGLFTQMLRDTTLPQRRVVIGESMVYPYSLSYFQIAYWLKGRLRVPFGIGALLRPLCPGVTIAVQSNARYTKTIATLFEFGGTIRWPKSDQVREQRPRFRQLGQYNFGAWPESNKRWFQPTSPEFHSIKTQRFRGPVDVLGMKMREIALRSSYVPCHLVESLSLGISLALNNSEMLVPGDAAFLRIPHGWPLPAGKNWRGHPSHVHGKVVHASQVNIGRNRSFVEDSQKKL